VVDKNKLRPVDLKIVYGTNKKIKNITGWEPAIDIRTSLTDILNWWRTEKGAD
jgi:GDP-4-dehydro-6-deoxy-D-mannose reductase